MVVGRQHHALPSSYPRTGCMAVPIGTCTALARFIGGSAEMPVNGSVYPQISENLYTKGRIEVESS